MHPILFQRGPITIYTYGVLVATGVLLALWYSRRQAPAFGLDPDRVWNIGIYGVLSGLIVAKLWLIALYAGYYWQHPREIFALSTLQSGGTFYGGALGALAVLFIYTRFAKVPLLALMDTFAVAWVASSPAAATASPPGSPGASPSPTLPPRSSSARPSAFRSTLLSSTNPSPSV
jgi:phosphatidylglycerol---prolipoprotein diacylglyceryl transferase